jgi:hypothetical protein
MEMTEIFPAFVMNGEEIVDVFYIPHEERNGNWHPIGIIKFEPSGPSTHTVLETPLGCFQWNATTRSGEILSVTNGSGGVPLVPCQRVQSNAYAAQS